MQSGAPPSPLLPPVQVENKKTLIKQEKESTEIRLYKISNNVLFISV